MFTPKLSYNARIKTSIITVIKAHIQLAEISVATNLIARKLSNLICKHFTEHSSQRQNYPLDLIS